MSSDTALCLAWLLTSAGGIAMIGGGVSSVFWAVAVWAAAYVATDCTVQAATTEQFSPR